MVNLSWTGVEVRYTSANSRGFILFTPSVPRVFDIDSTPGLLLEGVTRVPLVAGSMSVVLPATDSATTNPSGFSYTVTEQIIGKPSRSYTIQLPQSLALVGVDLTSVSPADPGTPNNVNGYVVLRWDSASRIWPVRSPALQWGVIFNSANDPTATAPVSLNIKTGDEWVKHPSAP